MADTFPGSDRAPSCNRKGTQARFSAFPEPICLTLTPRSGLLQISCMVPSRLSLIFQTCELSISCVTGSMFTPRDLLHVGGWGGCHLPILQIRKLRLRAMKGAARKPHEAPGSSVSLSPSPVSGETTPCVTALETPFESG